jgi:YihY family inner membrane protein
MKPRTSLGSSSNGLISIVAALALLVATVRAASRSADRGSNPSTVGEGDALQPDPALPEPEGLVDHLRWQVDCWQRTHSVLAFPVAVAKKFGQDKAGHLAALVAYYGFFSLFPLMLAFTSLLGFVVRDPQGQQRFADAAADQIPVVGETIRDTAGRLDGSSVAVIVGLSLALWSGMRIVDAMQNALNTVWSVPRLARPNIVERRIRGIAMLGLIGGGLVCSVIASRVAGVVDVIPGAGRIAIWAASALVSVVLFMLAFRLLTDATIPWRDVWPGALFGGLSWWALQTFGAAFIADQQQSSGEAYGQFASIIALFAFLFLASQLSIVGAEINVVRARRLWPRSLIPGQLTAADVEAFELLANSTRQDESYRVVLRRQSDRGDSRPR